MLPTFVLYYVVLDVLCLIHVIGPRCHSLGFEQMKLELGKLISSFYHVWDQDAHIQLVKHKIGLQVHNYIHHFWYIRHNRLTTQDLTRQIQLNPFISFTTSNIID